MFGFKFTGKKNISRLPKTPGIYAFKKGAKLLYIGKAANLKERVKNHFQQPHSVWEQTLLRQGYGGRVGYIVTNSEIEALILEAKLIKKFKPKYNIVWRDDKNYFFVGITKEKFPTVFITHQPRPVSRILYPVSGIKSKKIRNTKYTIQNTNYVGPFVEGRALKQALNALRRIFPYRTCKPYSGKPCLWYQLGRCPGPCLLGSKLAKDLPALEKNIEKESQRNARNLFRFLAGGKIQALKELEKEMESASKSQDFERAATVRDQIWALERILSHSRLLETIESEKNAWPETEKELKRILNIAGKISRIEAYDVSNIQGNYATGSMVTFINGRPKKSFYRKFKIKIEQKPNDTAMIKEILSRRFSHFEWGWPDLILIDGGVGQLSAARQTKAQSARPRTKNIKILAIAKRNNELYIEGQKQPLLLKKLPRDIFNLILQLRDEAHRFAISYHRKLREKF